MITLSLSSAIVYLFLAPWHMLLAFPGVFASVPVTHDQFESFLIIFAAACDEDTWVADGNYHRVAGEVILQRATLVVFVDYGFVRTVYQALYRAIARICDGREIWEGSGNRESFSLTFMSKDSVLLWTLTSYRRIKERYEKILEAKERDEPGEEGEMEAEDEGKEEETEGGRQARKDGKEIKIEKYWKFKMIKLESVEASREFLSEVAKMVK